MSFCVTEGGSFECLFIDRLNNNFRSFERFSSFSLFEVSTFLFSSFTFFLRNAFATRLFSHRLRFFGPKQQRRLRCLKPKTRNQIHLTLCSSSLVALNRFSYFAITSFSDFRMDFLLPRPITVFKSKANENNPHSWLASFWLLFRFFCLFLHCSNSFRLIDFFNFIVNRSTEQVITKRLSGY